MCTPDLKPQHTPLTKEYSTYGMTYGEWNLMMPERWKCKFHYIQNINHGTAVLHRVNYQQHSHGMCECVRIRAPQCVKHNILVWCFMKHLQTMLTQLIAYQQLEWNNHQSLSWFVFFCFAVSHFSSEYCSRW